MLKNMGIVVGAAVLASVLGVTGAKSLGVDKAAVVGGAVGGTVAGVVAVQLARPREKSDGWSKEDSDE